MGIYAFLRVGYPRCCRRLRFIGWKAAFFIFFSSCESQFDIFLPVSYVVVSFPCSLFSLGILIPCIFLHHKAAAIVGLIPLLWQSYPEGSWRWCGPIVELSVLVVYWGIVHSIFLDCEQFPVGPLLVPPIFLTFGNIQLIWCLEFNMCFARWTIVTVIKIYGFLGFGGKRFFVLLIIGFLDVEIGILAGYIVLIPHITHCTSIHYHSITHHTHARAMICVLWFWNK